MSKRRYPLAMAALRQRRKPWQELSLAITELGDRNEATITIDQGLLAGVEIVVGPDQVRFIGLNSHQERLLARQADALAKRTGRPVVIG